MQKMNLPQIGLRRISCHTRPMFHSDAKVCVALYPVALDEFNARMIGLREGMLWTGVNGDNLREHGVCVA